MQVFGGKRCHFLRRCQKNKKKNKDFRVLVRARPEESKIFGFLGFFGTPPEDSKIFGFFPGKCKFLVENAAISRGGTKKNQKKPKDFRVLARARPEESKIFGFFGFFGTPPGKCKFLVENAAIS